MVTSRYDKSQYIFCAKLHWYWPSGFRVEDFYMSSMYFHYVAIIYPWKNARQFIWPLNNLKQRILCVKFGWNCPRGFWEKDFKSCQLQKKTLCRYYLSIKKDKAVHLNETGSPLLKDVLCQVRLKLYPVFLKKKSSMYFSLCRYYLSLIGTLHLNYLESSSHMYALCQLWLK